MSPNYSLNSNIPIYRKYQQENNHSAGTRSGIGNSLKQCNNAPNIATINIKNTNNINNFLVLGLLISTVIAVNAESRSENTPLANRHWAKHQFSPFQQFPLINRDTRPQHESHHRPRLITSENKPFANSRGTPQLFSPFQQSETVNRDAPHRHKSHHQKRPITSENRTFVKSARKPHPRTKPHLRMHQHQLGQTIANVVLPDTRKNVIYDEQSARKNPSQSIDRRLLVKERQHSSQVLQPDHKHDSVSKIRREDQLENRKIFKTFSVDNYNALAFHYENLSKVNPTRKNIFDSTCFNVQSVMHSAKNKIEMLNNAAIIKDINDKLGRRITDSEADQISNSIINLHNIMDYFFQNKNKFLFYSYNDAKSDHKGPIGVYRQGTISLNDQFFIKNPVWQAFILLHELTHAIKTEDHFYLKANFPSRKVKNGAYITKELIDLPIAEAFPIFVSSLRRQIREKSSYSNQEFISNADTITIYAFLIFSKEIEFNKKIENRNILRETRNLILSSQNNERFSSLA